MIAGFSRMKGSGRSRVGRVSATATEQFASGPIFPIQLDCHNYCELTAEDTT